MKFLKRFWQGIKSLIVQTPRLASGEYEYDRHTGTLSFPTTSDRISISECHGQFVFWFQDAGIFIRMDEIQAIDFFNELGAKLFEHKPIIAPVIPN